MRGPLLPLLFASLAVQADDQVLSPTGRILRPGPPPALAPVREAPPAEDPWPWRGPWEGLQLRATMLSSTGAAAVLEDPKGGVHTVHVGTRIGTYGERVNAISAGRVDLLWETGNADLDRAFCLLVIERVAVSTPAPPPEEPTRGRRGAAVEPPPPVITWQTQHRKAACGPTPELVDPRADSRR